MTKVDLVVMFRKLLKPSSDILDTDRFLALELNPTFDEFFSFGNDIDTTKTRIFSAMDTHVWFSVNWDQPLMSDVNEPFMDLLTDAQDAPLVIPQQENTRNTSWRQFLSDRQKLSRFLATDNLATDQAKPTFRLWYFQVCEC